MKLMYVRAHNNCRTCGKSCYGKYCRHCYAQKGGARISQIIAMRKKKK